MFNVLKAKSLRAVLSLLDYLTIFQLKYTSKSMASAIRSLNSDSVLDLRNTKLKNENNTIYMILSKHKFLTEVILEFRPINDTHVFKFTASLIKININYCQNVTDAGLKHIAETCPNLTHLDLYVMPNLTDEGLVPIVKKCKQLIHLNLSGNKRFTSASLELIPKYLNDLEEIDLTRCIGTTDAFLIELVSKCRQLRYLNLYALPDITCSFLGKLNHSNLAFLDLCGNINVDDALFIIAAEHLSNLAYLNLSWCVKLTDEAIRAIYDKCNRLELISLHGILGITDQAVTLLSSNNSIAQKLTTIDLFACVNVKDKSEGYLLKLFPNLRMFKHFL